MTKEQAIKELRVSECYDVMPSVEALDMAIKALEQQPSDDVMAIHTQGLDEGIRCAMCTNSMRSDRGCDGGCVVNEDMYKKVMDTIKNQMFSQPTSDDCVSRQAVIAIASDSCLDLDNYEDTKEFCDEIRELPPVTPTHGTCKDCRHYYMDEDGHGYHCEKFDYTRFPVYADFYCADFEKRGGENE